MLPFLGRGMTRHCVHSCGQCLVAQIYWHRLVRTFPISSLPPLINSDETLSTQGVLSSLQVLKSVLDLLVLHLQVLWISIYFLDILEDVQVCRLGVVVQLTVKQLCHLRAGSFRCLQSDTFSVNSHW